MPSASGPLLLDTHMWLWWAEDNATLASEIALCLDQASWSGRLQVSAISVWEIALLEAKGRISLAKPCPQWVDEALTLDGLTLVPISPAIAVASTRLPGTPHGDPADRLIIATALAEGATLVTRDQAIIDYGRLGHVAVMAG
jgi:PIN domain nuclease of toxin-antitoxin system